MRWLPQLHLSLLCIGAAVVAGLGGCSNVPAAAVSSAQPADADPIDLVPVARFLSPVDVDDIAHCIGEGWARLSVIAVGKVTLHPSLRGLIVDVKAQKDPLARAYVEVYPLQGATRIDYYIRSFVQDPDEDLRLRALQNCL